MEFATAVFKHLAKNRWLVLSLTLFALAAPGRAARLTPARAVVHTRAVLHGALVDGPKHSLHAIAGKPVRYAGTLLGIGALGAGAKTMGLDAEPIALGLSVAATTWSAWKAIPALKAAKGAARSRLVGREILWPVTLSAGTTVLGTLGHETAGHAVGAKQIAKQAAKAGLQSAIIGADVPTIAQTILDKGK